MYKILEKKIFSPDTFLWEVSAPDIARVARPGQFVMIRLKREGSERIPLTIADFDREKGTITLVVKVVGKTTEEMSRWTAGEFSDLMGPLGRPTVIEKKGHVVLVGGGLGVAPIFPILRGFKEVGSGVTSIIGFREKSYIFWEERFRSLSDGLVLMTDDGSVGMKGTTVDGLRYVIARTPAGGGGTKQSRMDRHAPPDGGARDDSYVNIDEVLAVGPIVMMEAVANVTRSLGIPTVASINSIMVDGIGMCGSCRVSVAGKTLFACVDGPDMDAHKVDFEELKTRQRRFHGEEQGSLKRYREECALGGKGI